MIGFIGYRMKIVVRAATQTYQVYIAVHFIYYVFRSK